jgi:hypothetical protein
MGRVETLNEVVDRLAVSIDEKSIAANVNQVLTSHEIKKLINDAKIKTYYLYSSKDVDIKETNSGRVTHSIMKSPVVTVCLMHIPELNLWARGVSVCSPKDFPKKKYGKILARANAAKLIAAKLLPNRYLHRVLTDDVKLLLDVERRSRKIGVLLQHDYVPSIRSTPYIQRIINTVSTTARNVNLTDQDRDLENEINPIFTPHEQRLLTEKKTVVA